MFIRENSYSLIAIVLGLIITAGAVYSKDVRTQASSNVSSIERSTISGVYGDKDASITIVEFSDFQCPFCAQLHTTLKRIVDESEGSIKWVYRHFPLPNHPQAMYAAIVSECVLHHSSNEAFWQFSDTLFNNQRQITKAYIDETAVANGLTQDILSTCVDDQAITNEIETDMSVARNLGGSGTPFSVIINADGTTKPVSGALPYAQWKALLQ